MSNNTYTNQLKRVADEITCPEDLLKRIRLKFPDKLPNHLVTDGLTNRLIGQQDVVKYVQGIIDMINNS